MGSLKAFRIGGVLRTLGVLLPLAVFGGAQAQAFPNVGVNLQEAIQKQSREFKESRKPGAFKFGILGSFEVRIVSHRFQSDWEGVLARIADETDVYERCGSSGTDCPPGVRQWRSLLDDLKERPVDVQLARLNKAINKMAQYADDDVTFGKKDYWATPLEFFKGKADCEDYAAVKFWSLLELGFSNDQLRLAVVKDRRRRIMHAVVTVKTGGKTIVLDSLFDHPIEQRHVLKYAPVYSANLGNQWAHIVTKKIRVSYINQLENRLKAGVVKVKAKSRTRPAVRPVAAPDALAAVTKPKPREFVDWT